MSAKIRRQINNELFKVTARRLDLGLGLGEVAEILERHLGEEAREKVHGFYCGEFGECFESFENLDCGIVLQWGHSKLEVAYIS